MGSPVARSAGGWGQQSPAPNQTGTATQTLSYCYDPLNRVTGKAYSAQSCSNGRLPSGTAVVSYTYDAGTNGIGQMTSLTDQAGSGSYAYDALGRILAESRTIAGITNNMSYGYYLDSSINTLTYPSGAVITYTPWNNGTNAVAGTAQSAIDNGNSINYAKSANYQADGQLTALTLGNSGSFNGIAESFQYNNRLQICRITALTTGSMPGNCADSTHTGNVMDLGYNLSLGAGDNGNVLAVSNYKDSTRSQTFTYDALNRLTSAQNSGTNCSSTSPRYWGNSYIYDPWGNLLQKNVTKCSAENLQVTVNANNQLQGGYTFDAAGNMTYDATANLNYNYDPENRFSTVGNYAYTYDDDGNRVVKQFNKIGMNNGTIYWHMSLGVVAETATPGSSFTGSSEYIFFNGARVARRDGGVGASGVLYYFSDHLRTTNIVTDALGNIKNESDFYPWGGELQLTANDPSNHYKFTGKERDGETGLDYFGARYYSSGIGRFVTPDWASTAVDVPYADLADPQSLNLYIYVRNRPTVLADSDGHLIDGLDSSLNMRDREGPFEAGTNSGMEASALASFTGTETEEQAGPIPLKPPCSDDSADTKDKKDKTDKKESKDDSKSKKRLGESKDKKALQKKAREAQKTGATERMTNKQATEAADKLGFRTAKDPPFDSHGSKVFTNGKVYITADKDLHSGGTWKVFSNNGRRLGTYNADLTRKIGD